MTSINSFILNETVDFLQSAKRFDETHMKQVLMIIYIDKHIYIYIYIDIYRYIIVSRKNNNKPIVPG